MEMDLTIVAQVSQSQYKQVFLLEGRMDELAKKVKPMQEAEMEDERLHSELKSRNSSGRQKQTTL